MPQRISILGVPVDAITRKEAVAQVVRWSTENVQRHFVTPNPEMVVAAQHSPEFLRVLMASALALPDGTGLLWAAKRLGTPLSERVAGVDVLSDLCAHDIGPTFFLGAAHGVAARAVDVVRKKNPGLRVAGSLSGSPRDADASDIVNRINQSGATILFVAFGAPAQDLWIAKHLPEMSNVRIAMGVGGSFDFLAGVQTRAPEWMRSAGLEWLWRLIRQPKRIGRIWNAVVVFPWMVLRGR